jgi:hypothetical protein
MRFCKCKSSCCTGTKEMLEEKVEKVEKDINNVNIKINAINKRVNFIYNTLKHTFGIS